MMLSQLRTSKATRLIESGLLLLLLTSRMSAQSFLADIALERDPIKRSELALSYADESFEKARGFYQTGAVEKGDAALENMTSALDACVKSLAAGNKVKFYKKAELKVAFLQRRMSGLIEDLGVQERGWAEQSTRALEAIHEKLLDGVMRK